MPAAEEPEPLSVGDIDYGLGWDLDRRLRLGRRLSAQIDAYLQDTSDRRGQCETLRDYWNVMGEPLDEGDSTGYWENPSNVNTGATRWVCNGHHIRINQQIIGASPPFTVVARGPDAQSLVSRIEEALESLLLEAEWPRIANLVHKELPQVGSCFLKTTYEFKYRRVPRRQVELNDDVTAALMQGGFEPEEAMVQGLSRDRQGRIRRMLTFRDELAYAGIEFAVIPWEDGVILPSSAARWQDAYAIGERVVLTGEQLRRGVADGRYLEEEVEELLKRQSDPPDDAKHLRWDQQGLHPGAAGLDHGTGEFAEDDDAAPYREYVCYELCLRLDGNDDGELEWCLVTLHKGTSRILRLQYLPWEHGRPHYTLFTFGEEAGKLFGQGVAELISGLQDAHNAIFNQIADHGDYVHALHNNFFYDKTAGFNPTKHRNVLGQPIPVKDVRGIQQITCNPLPAEHYNQLSVIKEMIELLSQTSNPALGRETDSQKTLGEVQIVMAAANQSFEDTAAHIARTWAEVFDQVRWLVAQFPQQGGEARYRRSTRPRLDTIAQPAQPGGMGAISVSDLLADVDILPTGEAQLADAQMRLQRAQVLLQTLGVHPLTAQNVAVQLIVLDDYLQQFQAPQRERIMAEVVRGLQVQVAAQQEVAAENEAVREETRGQAMGALESGAAAGAQGAMMQPPGQPGTNGAAPLGIPP
jgi:hypothetical protein